MSDCRHYLYFNAGFFYYQCPKNFGQLFCEYAVEIRKCRPQELTGQTLRPRLDQVTLPLVIHALWCGHAALPPGYMDGAHSCHYRLNSLVCARENDSIFDLLESVTAPEAVKAIFPTYVPFKSLIYHQNGARLRGTFDLANLLSNEHSIRDTIKATSLWLR